MTDWLADLHAALDETDPDAALARFAGDRTWLGRLPSPPTPPAFVGLAMIAGALVRVGREPDGRFPAYRHVVCFTRSQVRPPPARSVPGRRPPKRT